VVVVIAEHSDDGHRKRRARLGEDRRLFGEPVRRQISREEDEVDVLSNRSKGAGEALLQRLSGVDVAGCRDPNRAGHRS
jgi:hypothetical protein